MQIEIIKNLAARFPRLARRLLGRGFEMDVGAFVRSMNAATGFDPDNILVNRAGRLKNLPNGYVVRINGRTVEEGAPILAGEYITLERESKTERDESEE